MRAIRELFMFAFAVWAFLGWVLYFMERDRSRDYATDLMCVIHDYDLDVRDLRRSLEHGEIRQYLSAEVEPDDPTTTATYLRGAALLVLLPGAVLFLYLGADPVLALCILCAAVVTMLIANDAEHPADANDA